jgi:flavin reductase ActVB
MTVDARTFRDAMASVAMPVSVVTIRDAAGKPHGTTVGSVCSLSLAPPLLMFCLAHRASVHDPVCAAERFCVSVLAGDQQEVAERFTGDPARRFRPDQDTEFEGLPAVRGALSHLLCVRHHLIEAGDHTIVIGEVRRVERAAAEPGRPLVYHERRYHALEQPAFSGVPIV